MASGERIFTFRWSNITVENGPFIDDNDEDFPWFTHKTRAFPASYVSHYRPSAARLATQVVHPPLFGYYRSPLVGEILTYQRFWKKLKPNRAMLKVCLIVLIQMVSYDQTSINLWYHMVKYQQIYGLICFYIDKYMVWYDLISTNIWYHFVEYLYISIKTSYKSCFSWLQTWKNHLQR